MDNAAQCRDLPASHQTGDVHGWKQWADADMVLHQG